MQELSFCWPLKVLLQEHLNRCGVFLLWRSLAESEQREQNYEKTTHKSVHLKSYLGYIFVQSAGTYLSRFHFRIWPHH